MSGDKTDVAVNHRHMCMAALPDAEVLPSVRGHVIRCLPVDPTGREHYVAFSFTDVPPKTRAAGRSWSTRWSGGSNVATRSRWTRSACCR